MDFFARFDEARDEFTYDDEAKPNMPVIQVGLAATFFLENSWNRRPAIMALMERYRERYGSHLTWLTFGERVRQKRYTPENLDKLRNYVLDDEAYNTVEFQLSSLDIDHVGDYEFSMFSSSDWKENLHKYLSYVRYYLPVEALRGDGRATFEAFLKEACDLLQPLHAQAGLAVQECYAHEDYQHVEYEVAQEFLGLDVAHPVVCDDTELRKGFKTVNWYTILADSLLARLGGAESLPTRFNDPRIALLPYAGGAMIRAGDWPELGWVERDPSPELYVKVNRVLRPVRAEEISLAYGSAFGETRFNTRTSDLWLRRFDDDEADVRDAAPAAASGLRLAVLTAHPGEPCPADGEWYSVNWDDRRAILKKGEPMPGPEYSNTGLVVWHQRQSHKP